MPDRTIPCWPPPLRVSRRALLGGLALAGSLNALAQESSASAGWRFGVLPIGGTLDSRTLWEPLLSEMVAALGQPISMFSATSYEVMDQAVRQRSVDIAFLSGKLALDAVTVHGMHVIAQVVRQDGLPGYRALLLARRQGQPTSLDAVLADPSLWRLARGEKRSMSGYIVPKLELFLPRGIDIETRFRDEIVGTHQQTALALINDRADVATSNTADFDRFKNQFPAEAAQLRTLWQSELIPHGFIVIRRPPVDELHERAKRFLTEYGRGPGKPADEQRARLKQVQVFAGFVKADNRALLPVAELTRKLDLDSTASAQWINDAARQARLQRIEALYQQQLKVLNAR